MKSSGFPAMDVVVSALHAELGRARVRRQAFSMSELGGDAAQLERTLARNADHARAFLEIVHPERRGEARGARSRQDVVRARAVVAQRFGRIAAEENRPGMANRGKERLRVVDRKLEMLGG